MRSLTIIAMLLLAQNPAAPARAIGVLVGLHHHGTDDEVPPAAGQLRTIWIPVMNAPSAAPIGPIELADLLLPRRSGFWRAGLLGTCAEQPHKNVDDEVLGTETEIVDYLWMTPVGRRPQVRLEPRDSLDPPERVGPCTARDTACDIDRRTSIFWIWPEYISAEFGLRASCGAHESWTPGYTVRRPDNLASSVSIGEALGNAAEQQFRRAFELEVREAAEMLKECGEPVTFVPGSWHIERQPGGWKAEGWSTAHRLCGYGLGFTVDLDLSRVTGRKDDRSRWRTLNAQTPRLTDAHFSPDGRWVLATTESELLFFEDGASDRPAVAVPMRPGDEVVMVEWATGPNVARWDAQVRRARAAGAVAPVVLVR